VAVGGSHQLAALQRRASPSAISLIVRRGQILGHEKAVAADLLHGLAHLGRDAVGVPTKSMPPLPGSSSICRKVSLPVPLV